jgi:uncharacterized protein (TIGR03437 family)
MRTAVSACLGFLRGEPALPIRLLAAVGVFVATLAAQTKGDAPVAVSKPQSVLAAGVAYGAGDRITRTVDSSRTTVIEGNLHPLAQARFDQGMVDAGTELSYVTLLLRPDPSLPAFLADQGTPSSLNYRKWLNPEEFADRFGLSGSDIGKLRGWLESQGLRVNDVARGRHWITFSGTAAQVGKALHTEFHRYLTGGEMHLANAAEPSVPEAFGEVVAGFRGLNDFRPKPPMRTLSRQAVSPEYTSNGYHYLAPGDLATIYDLTPLYTAGITGAGQTIVVPGESDVLLSDIATFRQYWVLPVNNPKLMLFGPDPGLNVNALGEADMDLEWTGVIAPNATIIYAYAEDVYTALQYAVDQNLGEAISLSYGRCELEESSAFEAVAQQANAQGITVVAAAGDAGAATCDRYNVTPQASTGPTVSWPASFPEITAVGGTEFSDSSGNYWTTRNSLSGGSALSYIPEMAWNDSAALNALVAGGGGPSAIFPKPAWQVAPGVPNDGARDLPDISLTASWLHDPYLFESQGQFSYTGGTSASAQVFAGMVALLNQYLVSKGTLTSPGLANINPSLYRMAQAGSAAFHDITSGNTMVPCVQSSPGCVDGLLGYNAGPGYDLATGLGSIDLYLLATTWNNGLAATTTLTANPAATTPGGMVQLTATVKGTASGSGPGGSTPTGTVSFTVDGVTGLNTAILAPVTGPGELPLGSAVLDGNGTATISEPGSLLSLGNSTIRALYSGDGVFEGSAGSAKVTVNYPPSTISVVVPLVTPNPVVEDGYEAWPYTVALVERAGVATTLTSFTLDGVPQSLTYWTSTNLPANGTIYASLTATSLTTPLNRQFVFTGEDASGQTWTQQVAVPFVSGPTTPLIPGITLTTATPLVPQNPQAPFACQWAQEVSLQETGGFLTLLASMSVNGVNFTPQIQNIFGTTRLAPYGLLEGTLCFNSTGPSVTQLAGITDSGGFTVLVPATVSATLAPAPNTPVAFSAPQPGATVNLAADATGAVAPALIPVSFSGSGSPAWTVTVGPANQATNWLTVSPMSGTGSGTITVSGSAAGLSPGAYTAVLSIASANALPQVVNVVVTLTVGESSSILIGGLVNNFSGGLTAAPGMIAAVFGTGMAPAGTALSAPFLPLPLSLAGVSATVNGVSAPLYYVSPGQVNLQIPYETGAGTAVLAIDNNGQIATLPFSAAVTAPGLYPAAFDNSTGSEVTSAKAAQVLVLYMTGEGDVTPTLATGATPAPSSNPSTYPQPRQAVTVSIGGVPATVLFQAIPYGLAGATQIDLIVPAGAGPGPQQLVVTVGGVAAPALNLTIAAAGE